MIEGELSSYNEVMIDIKNIQGSSVYNEKKSFEGNTTSSIISIDDRFPSGLYIVHVLINEKVYVEKLIIE